jgi:hypothetical protein
MAYALGRLPAVPQAARQQKSPSYPAGTSATATTPSCAGETKGETKGESLRYHPEVQVTTTAARPQKQKPKIPTSATC